MREVTYKIIIENELRSLNAWKFAITQCETELETMTAEYSAIKATSYDKMPVGSGENLQEEKLITAIAKKDQKEAELKLNKRKVADIERLIEQLPDDERRVIERMVINQEKYALDSLCEELNCEQAQVYRIRSRAIRNMAKLRHGAAYHE